MVLKRWLDIFIDCVLLSIIFINTTIRRNKSQSRRRVRRVRRAGGVGIVALSGS